MSYMYIFLVTLNLLTLRMSILVLSWSYHHAMVAGNRFTYRVVTEHLK